MTSFDLSAVPAPVPLRLPVIVERVLPNGLKVVAARRGGTALAELRINIPFAHADPATAVLLSGAIAADQQVLDRTRMIGGTLTASVDADFLRISGSVPVESLDRLLGLAAEVLLAPRYRAAEFDSVVESMTQATAAMLASPANRALEAINHRMFGEHPYGLPMPRPAALRSVSRSAVASLHRERIFATGTSLVVAGGFDLESVLSQVEVLWGAWPPGPGARRMKPVPAWEPGSMIVDEPGSGQSLLRATMTAPAPHAPDYTALAVATLVFGGYFSSRLVQNLREYRGISYSPRCLLLHTRETDLVVVSVDVTTPNTRVADREITAELRGLVENRVTGDELDRTRRYAAGSLRRRLSTSSGLVSALCELDLHQLTTDWLRDYDSRLSALDPEQVATAADRYLRPDKALSVWLCDAAGTFPPCS
ncbi:M16 family metallopeptidase [Amycolatopsis sp. H20-H5]|uniref:M16 family metallopeptidase n=1 Tax=Amycolatopsis sp. H20-H5 TaxID=3046309 RepID=UPI002DB5B3B4|nr:pitrilysin family protein [Amycolatopsis sp. H20-H5]MEC3975565.1 pitrilysin family protein [Amycolatopsis sp. H20-H5]